LLIEGDTGRYSEMTAPMLSLRFDYAGHSVRCSDPTACLTLQRGGEVQRIDRDFSAEARAQRLLEAFGAVELGCLPHCEPDFDSQADYVLQLDGNVHAFCSFTAHVVPQLRAKGWLVEIDPDYPYQVVATEPVFYANVEPVEDDHDWFNLELGVELEGRHVNLLPALLELLEGCSNSQSLNRLLNLSARYRAVRVGDNRYVTVPPERLRRLLETVLELYRGDELVDGALRFSRLQAAALGKLANTLADGKMMLAKSPDLERRARSLAEPHSVSSPSPTPNLRAALRPYQMQGLCWLQRLREQEASGILADDMGLGKTLQTIAHLAAEKHSGRMRQPALIIVPTSLVGNWRRELARFSPSLSVCVWHGKKRAAKKGEAVRADVVISTYPLLIRDLPWFKEHAYYLVILDEAQAIKNPRSLANRAARQLESQHRLCLTGTPVENNLEELWSLFEFLMPGFLGDADHFRSRFRDPIERDGSEVQLAALRSRLAPFILRRMKEHVARDLPPKTELVRAVELSGEQRELYETIRVAAHRDVRRAIRNKGISASTITILDGLMKLRQVCCDPRLLAVPSARRVRGSAKYELFFELVTQELGQGRSILVFSQFTRMLALLARGLDERRIGHAVLTGATLDRQKPIDTFQRGDVRIFLISLKAGGTGLNLTRADTVIHYDPWWNAAAQAQATDRAYRIGQTRPVFVHRLIVAGSVEERMLRLQQRKQKLADSILDSGGPENSALSPREVEDLFAPLTDA
jgi:SNF2 family DNA or RNA helicase